MTAKPSGPLSSRCLQMNIFLNDIDSPPLPELRRELSAGFLLSVQCSASVGWVGGIMQLNELRSLSQQLTTKIKSIFLYRTRMKGGLYEVTAKQKDGCFFSFLFLFFFFSVSSSFLYHIDMLGCPVVSKLNLKGRLRQLKKPTNWELALVWLEYPP